MGSAPGNTTDCSSTWITSNWYPDARRLQAHETLGPPTEVRSMQSEWLVQTVTISLAQNTVLGKNITTVPYATTKRPRRMPSIFFETSRRIAGCCFCQRGHAVTQKHHLLTPHSSRASQRPPQILLYYLLGYFSGLSSIRVIFLKRHC